MSCYRKCSNTGTSLEGQRECPVEKQGKNMRIPVGRYVSWKPQCSEMFSWYGERGKRDRGKEGGCGLTEGGCALTRKLWNIYPDTQLLPNILEFTQHLISSITDLLIRQRVVHPKQHSTNCKCLQTFQKKLHKIQSTMLRCLMLKTLHFVISPPFRGSIYG
jgi:hypothetical protein